jgi:hypothetical protein
MGDAMPLGRSLRVAVLLSAAVALQPSLGCFTLSVRDKERPRVHSSRSWVELRRPDARDGRARVQYRVVHEGLAVGSIGGELDATSLWGIEGDTAICMRGPEERFVTLDEWWQAPVPGVETRLAAMERDCPVWIEHLEDRRPADEAILLWIDIRGEDPSRGHEVVVQRPESRPQYWPLYPAAFLADVATSPVQGILFLMMQLPVSRLSAN